MGTIVIEMTKVMLKAPVSGINPALISPSHYFNINERISEFNEEMAQCRNISDSDYRYQYVSNHPCDRRRFRPILLYAYRRWSLGKLRRCLWRRRIACPNNFFTSDNSIQFFIRRIKQFRGHLGIHDWLHRCGAFRRLDSHISQRVL